MGTRERPERSVSSSYRADEVGGQEARQGCVAEQVSLVLGPFAIRGAPNTTLIWTSLSVQKNPSLPDFEPTVAYR